MSPIIAIPEVEEAPPAPAILTAQGIPKERPAPERIRTLFEQAATLYVRLTQPRGLWIELSREEFAAVYAGEGQNEPEGPVAAIYPRADRLALFAVTLGAEVSQTISELFATNEPALGYMLDTIASHQADHAADLACRAFVDSLRTNERTGAEVGALPYSPGYCGWHVSGQRRLFARLRPEQVGIKLNESCLMQPLKSVSGVFLAGPPEIHDFEDGYPFCLVCPTHQCRERIASVHSPVPPSRQGE